MNVLFQNRPANLWIGGDGIQLEKTMTAVSDLGVNVEFNDQALIKPALRLRKFDIVHTFNFSMPWTRYQVWAAKNARKKAVCTMIYHEGEEFTPYKEQQIMLDSLDAMIFATEGEKERVRRHLTMDESKAHVIPNGIDSWWFDNAVIPPVDLPPFVLTVGRLEPFKGQLATAKACKELGYLYVCIGQIVDNDYAENLKKEGALLLTPMSHEDLRKFYVLCKTYVLASRAEVMPLTVMEAGSQGTNIVLTNHCEWQIPNAEYVEFDQVDQIREAIKKSVEKPFNSALKDLLKTMTWESVAKQHIELYERILKG